MKFNSNVKAGVLYFLGSIFDKAIALITIPIFTRLLSVDEYGILCTYLAWEAIISVFVNLSLSNTIRIAFVDFENEMPKYLSSIITLSLLSTIIIGAIIVLISSCLNVFSLWYLIPLCVIQASFENIINIYKTNYMMEMEYVKRTLLCSLPNFIIAICSILFILYLSSDKYVGRIWSYVIIEAFIAISYNIYTVKKGGFGFNIKFWTYALSISLPLVFHSLSQVILSQADRTMLTRLIGPAETAVYSLVYNLSLAILVISTSFESVWIPWFTKKIESSQIDDVNRYGKHFIYFFALLAMMFMLVSPEIIKILAPPEYWVGISFAPIIIVTSVLLFWISFYINNEYYYKQTKHIMFNTIIAASLNIVLNFFLIPYYGAFGAASTTLITYFVSFLLHYRKSQTLNNELIPIHSFIPSAIMFWIVGCISVFLKDYWLARFIICFAIGAYTIRYFFKVKALFK